MQLFTFTAAEIQLIALRLSNDKAKKVKATRERYDGCYELNNLHKLILSYSHTNSMH